MAIETIKQNVQTFFYQPLACLKAFTPYLIVTILTLTSKCRLGSASLTFCQINKVMLKYKHNYIPLQVI